MAQTVKGTAKFLADCSGTIMGMPLVNSTIKTTWSRSASLFERVWIYNFLIHQQSRCLLSNGKIMQSDFWKGTIVEQYGLKIG